MANTREALAGASGLAFFLSIQPLGSDGAQADAYEIRPGTKTYDLMIKHWDFFSLMPGCCSVRDGRPTVFKKNEGPDKEAFPLIAVIEETLAGYKLPQPHEEKIPAEKIRTLAAANAVCRPHRAQAKAEGKVSTCIPPLSFSVLWAMDNSTTPGVKEGTEPYRITNIYCAFESPSAE